MTEIETDDDYELNALCCIVQYPGQSFRIIEKAGMKADHFREGEYRVAFERLLQHGVDSTKKLATELCKVLPAYNDDAKIDEFFDRVPTVAHVEHHMFGFLRHAIVRKYRAMMLQVFANGVIPAEHKADNLADCVAKMKDEMDRVLQCQSPRKQDDGMLVHHTPDDLLSVPGFINSLTDFIMAAAPRPNRVLAFASALAMLSYLTGRRYTDGRGTFTNLYVVALADSGVGKDIGRKVCKQLANRVGMGYGIVDDFASGQGLEDALYETPQLLAMIDEFSCMMEGLKDKNSLNEKILSSMLTIFTSSGSVVNMRRKALTAAEREKMAENRMKGIAGTPRQIFAPHLALLATAIPDKFYKSLTEKLTDNGMLARMLIFEAGERSDVNKHPTPAAKLPDDVIEFAAHLAMVAKQLPLDALPEFKDATESPDAEAARDKVDAESNKLYQAASRNRDNAGMSVWSRSNELVNKLALLYAISENALQPTISANGIEWGWKVVKHSSTRMLEMAKEYIFTDQTDEDAHKIKNFLKGKGEPLNRSKVSHALGLSKDRMNKAEATLVDRGELEVIPGEKGGDRYVLTSIGKGKRK